MMKCPGQDTRYWKPGDVFDASCPVCGNAVEFFRNDTARACARCGCRVSNPKMDFGCAAHCPAAERCIGEFPPEIAAARREVLKQRKEFERNRRPKKTDRETSETGRNAMKQKRRILQIDEERCDGCGQCVLACAEGAIRIVDGKARVISDNLCDGLGACIGECPRDALHIIEREADAFDEAAVEARLKRRDAGNSPDEQRMECGCPSSRIQILAPAPPKQRPSTAAESALTHWPVQIRLISPHAPFLKGADLLVLADCAAVAHADLHRDLLSGRVVMMGCPKFDDAQAYIDRFAEIFRTAGIRSITTVFMEVPCCSGLPRIVRKALETAGAEIPVASIRLNSRGEVLEGDVI